MGTGTSREMFLQHCREHGSIVADGFDPSAVCGSSHEALPPIRNGAVMVDHAGLPGLLGVAERTRRRNLVKRNNNKRNDDNETRYDDNLIVFTHSYCSMLETPHRTRTRKHDDALNSRPWKLAGDHSRRIAD